MRSTMHCRLSLLLFCCLSLCGTASSIAVADPGDTVRIVIDHRNDSVGVFLEEWCEECVEGSTLHVPAKPLQIDVINTGTSVYTYEIGQQRTEMVEESDFGTYSGFRMYADRSLVEMLRDTGMFLYPMFAEWDSAKEFRTEVDSLIDMSNLAISHLTSVALIDSVQLRAEYQRRDSLKRLSVATEKAVRRFEESRRQFDRMMSVSQKLIGQMVDIDDAVYGSKGAMRSRIECLDALNQLPRNNAMVKNAASRFASAFDNDGTYRLSYQMPSMFANMRGLVTTLDQQLFAMDSLIQGLPTSEQEHLRNLAREGLECLNNFEEAMDVTLDAEEVVRTIVQYEDSLSLRFTPEQVRQAEEPVFRIQARRDNKHVYEAAVLGERGYTINMESSSPVRPSLGLSFILSPDSQFPEYGLKRTLDSREEIIESGTLRDYRFTWGITVGLTYSFLDYQDTRGFTVWVPELTINPGNDVRAVALGAGVSFLDVLKLSSGVIWSKHQQTVGNVVGDIIDSPQEFRVTDTFGFPDSGKWYVSLSVFIRPSLD